MKSTPLSRVIDSFVQRPDIIEIPPDKPGDVWLFLGPVEAGDRQPDRVFVLDDKMGLTRLKRRR